MKTEKKGLICVFKPENLMSTEAMREKFIANYLTFLEMESVEFKCWWCDQKKKEWGAFHVFRSNDELDAYLESDTWKRVIPERWGCKPMWSVVEVGLILSKKILTRAEDSWVSE